VDWLCSFGPKEGKPVGIILDLLVGTHTAAVSFRLARVEQDRPATVGCRLELGRHFAGVKWVWKQIGFSAAGEKQDRRIGFARLDVVVGRELKQRGKLRLFVC
jgi:hypothetical protein